MSKIGLIFLFIFMAVGGYGQQDHFVLIQADNDLPFYVRIREQTLNSTPQGHLIIPQLTDSIYRITIGFLKKAYPEEYPDEDFYIAIDKKDLGFQLKHQEGRGWILVNIQTQEQEMPVRIDTIENKTRLEGVKKDDAFSRLMAEVVGDTAVMYNSYVAIAAKDSSARKDSAFAQKDSALVQKNSSARKDSSFTRKDSSTAPKDSFVATIPDSSARRTDSIARKADSPRITSVSLTSIPQVYSEPAPPPPPAKAPAQPVKAVHIKKISEQRTATALRLSYTDHAKGHKTDTIDIQIPLEILVSPRVTAPMDTPSLPPANGAPPTSGTPPANGVDSVKTAAPPGSASKRPKDKLVVINSDCRNFASDDDAARLKGKMQAISDDEARIAAAKKVFKLKCFTTNQLKSLTEPFAKEAVKYRFLETAYPFVSDDRFRELSGLFTDSLYIAKFKTLTGANGQ